MSHPHPATNPPKRARTHTTPLKQPLEVDFQSLKMEICTEVHNALTRANNRFPHIPKHLQNHPAPNAPRPPPKTPKNSQTHPAPPHPSTQNATTDPKTPRNPPQKQPIEVDFQPPNSRPTRKTQNARTRANITLPHIPKHPKTHPATNTPKRKRKTRAKKKKNTPPREQRDPHHTRHPRPPPRRLPLPTHPYTYRLYPHRPTTIRIPVHHYVTRLVSAPTIPLACYCI